MSTRWLIIAVAVLVGLPMTTQAGEKTTRVYIGTYSQGTKSKGIYRAELNLETGRLSDPVLAGEAVNPSFVAIHPSGKFLYAVGEISDFQKKKTGGVSAFAIDAKTGDLTLLNQQPSSGAGPCHIVVDAQGKNVLVANYGGGSASVIPIQADGHLAKPSSMVQHKGSSVNKSRQEAPHAHSINLDKANRFAFVADLGLDKVLVYRFDAKTGTIAANDPPAVELAPGAGPRHFAFHPDGRRAYVINELDSTLTVLDYDMEKGVLTKGQTLSTLPEGFKGNNSTAEVVVHPTGKFVYGSNRGHNSIVAFKVGAEGGKLELVGHQGHQIKVPRNFNIDPSGRYLLVGSQDGDQVIVFRIDPQSGELSPTGSAPSVPRPVCIRFLVP